MTAENRQALALHLQTPDPADLPQRRHHLTQAGRVDRYMEVQRLAMAHLAHALQAREDSTS